jgi:hypothetical protein
MVRVPSTAYIPCQVRRPRLGRRGCEAEREVRHMEGMFLQSVPGMGSLVAGGLLLAMVVAAVVYAWSHEGPSHGEAKREPLKKAA